MAIALLGAIESLLSAVVADGMAGTKHDPDAELLALVVLAAVLALAPVISYLPMALEESGRLQFCGTLEEAVATASAHVGASSRALAAH